MSRHIDIEPFIRVLEMSNTKTDGSQYASGYNDATITILRSLRAIPTADVVEVIHGKWIFDFALDNYNFYSCSVCGRQATLLSKESTSEYFPYCHCGAKMDKERIEQ